jgi:stress-induced-phosphoprotein 1
MAAEANTLKEKGNAALGEGKYTEAIKFYTEAIALDPKNHVLFSNRSAAHAKNDNFEEALKDAEETVNIKPDWGKGYSRKGAALAYLKRWDEATETYTKGLQLDPSNPQLKEGLEECRAAQAQSQNRFTNPFADPMIYIKLKNDPRTSKWMDDPEYLKMISDIQTNPKSLGAKFNDPKVMTTLSVLLGVGDMGDDMEVDDSPPPPRKKTPPPKKEEPVVELPPEKKAALKEKEPGNAAYKTKNFEKALEHYGAALKHDPTDMTYHNNIAAVYFEQKKF